MLQALHTRSLGILLQRPELKPLLSSPHASVALTWTCVHGMLVQHLGDIVQLNKRAQRVDMNRLGRLAAAEESCLGLPDAAPPWIIATKSDIEYLFQLTESSYIILFFLELARLRCDKPCWILPAVTDLAPQESSCCIVCLLMSFGVHNSIPILP
jgi:hypothetical protein